MKEIYIKNLHQDPEVSCTDPRIRIRTKMSRIYNTDPNKKQKITKL
jgi:hypothetical protein